MSIHFVYPELFEDLWNTHPVGVKKLAYDQWLKLKPSPTDNLRIIEYLVERRKFDKRWIESKGVRMQHLRTILSQRHWENPGYYERIKIRPAQPYDRDLTDTHVPYQSDPERARKALEEAKRGLVRH